ncbi:MAG: hypothetical protein V4760_12470 [Bdellovibrionota bacterium]
MKSILGKSSIAISILALTFLAGCWWDSGVVKVGATEAVVQTNAPTRGPASPGGFMNTRMDELEPCREHAECSGRLLCLAGRCTAPDQNNRGQVGQYCSGSLECVSGLCSEGACMPSVRDKADNNFPCTDVTAVFCRSGVCRNGGCAPTAKFPGLPSMQCATPSDCVSGICTDGRCGFSSKSAATCVLVGFSASSPLECCSASIDGNGRCAGVTDAKCTQHGVCGGSVGRTCADIGTQVVSATQCCSGKAVGGRCSIDMNRSVQPCRLDRACRSGSCDPKSNVCENYGFSSGPKPGTNPSSY